MTPFLFILAALAAFRITVLIVRDNGPWDVFARLRKVARFSKLLSCVYCVSVWVGFLIEVSLYYAGVKNHPVVAVCIVFALSAVAIILDRTFTAQ